MIEVNILNKRFFVKKESDGQKLHSKGYGLKQDKNNFTLNNFEVLYLFEKDKVKVFKNNKELNSDDILKQTKVNKEDYIVYKDLRSKGYRIETGLKYGFTFRIYDKSKKHAIWLIEPTLENEKFKIKDFIGKNRVANSTKKKMLLAVVDNDLDVTYLEINWLRM